MEAACFPETSVYFYQTTRREISEDGHVQLYVLSNTGYCTYRPLEVNVLSNTAYYTHRPLEVNDGLFSYATYDFLMTVKVNVAVFLDVTPCGLVCTNVSNALAASILHSAKSLLP